METKWSIDVMTPEYVMISSDFSQQEPKLTAYVSSDPNMIKAFQEGRDIYAFIAAIAFNKTYEECLEFHPETGEYQPDGKARRNEAKTVVLGICYGRSVPSIGEQLYSHDEEMSDEEKTKKAQFVYDSVLKAFPNLERLMIQSQAFAHENGYVETILGRRRHLPDMMLDDFEFKPLPGYVNPNIDPLDLSTLDSVEEGIPESKIASLQREFSKYKYFGQIAKRTKQLYEEEHIKVVNNRAKINDARRQCVNCVDFETEILTDSGWKKYNEVNPGDTVYGYDVDKNEIVKTTVTHLNISNEPTQVHHLQTSSFDAVCTKNHRWVMRNFDTRQVRIFDTEHILKFHRPRYHILRIAPRKNEPSRDKPTARELADYILSGKADFKWVSELTFGTAEYIYAYFRDSIAKKGSVIFEDERIADVFQYLCLFAGKCCNKYKVTVSRKSKEKCKTYWKVSCPKKVLHETARIDSMKKLEMTVDGVWCPTTECGTWIARRNGKYYITGNSIIQGSAADFTKMALIRVANDPRWAAQGAEILTVVHDEIIAQAPLASYEAAAAILKEDMEESGAFLPFPIKCDTTVSYRWYGLDAPCKYPKPNSVDTDNTEEIQWIQYHLVECEYELPVFRDEDGNKPIGDAAHGVSGQRSEVMESAIEDYCARRNIGKDEFLDSIERKVQKGL